MRLCLVHEGIKTKKERGKGVKTEKKTKRNIIGNTVGMSSGVCK